MDIDISGISKQYGESIEVDLSEEMDSLEFNNQSVKFIEPINITGSITNLGELFVLEGELFTTIKVTCDRCLSSFNEKLIISINEKFSNQVKDNTDDINLFQGDNIDLDTVVKNIIILNLPIQFICNQECKGLCPKCGANKNLTECNCSDDDIDPRLEKLKSLFNIK